MVLMFSEGKNSCKSSSWLHAVNSFIHEPLTLRWWKSGLAAEIAGKLESRGSKKVLLSKFNCTRIDWFCGGLVQGGPVS